MLTTVLLSIGMVFLAELGDKSQLMALTFALRYRWWVVLGAITAAAAAIHLLSVGVGHFLGAALPTTAIAVAAGLTFLAVGGWTLWEHRGTAEEPTPTRTRATHAAPFFVVLSAFLLAELGDRTMFATAALATDYSWLGVWLGSTLGMVAADALAIAIGIKIGRHLPERTIGRGAGLLFLYLGTLTLTTALTPTLWLGLQLAISAIPPAIAALLLRRRHTAPHPAAQSTPNPKVRQG